jgi:hypothetical protein
MIFSVLIGLDPRATQCFFPIATIRFHYISSFGDIYLVAAYPLLNKLQNKLVTVIYIIVIIYINLRLAQGSKIDLGPMLQTKRSRVLFPMRSLELSIRLILPAALWPWGRPSL